MSFTRLVDDAVWDGSIFNTSATPAQAMTQVGTSDDYYYVVPDVNIDDATNYEIVCQVLGGGITNSYTGTGAQLGAIFGGMIGMGINVTESPYSADPTGATDATAAIQAALTDLYDIGGGSVYIPIGNYKLTSQLCLVSCVNLFGDGVASTLSFQGASGNGLEVVRCDGTGLEVDITASAGLITAAVPHSGFAGIDYLVGDCIAVNQSGGLNGILRVSGINPTTGAVTSLSVLGKGGSSGSAYTTANGLTTAPCNAHDSVLSNIYMSGLATLDYGLVVRRTTSIMMDNVWTNGFGKAGFVFDVTADCKIQRCTYDSGQATGFAIGGDQSGNSFIDCLAAAPGFNGETPVAGPAVYGWDIQAYAFECPSGAGEDQFVLQRCNAELSGNGSGFHINAQGVTLTDCAAYLNYQHGFLIGDETPVIDLSLKGCRAEGNNGLHGAYDGFHIVQATRPRLHDCQTSGGNHRYGLNLGSGVSNAEVFGGHFENAAGLTGAGVGWVNNSSGAFLLGNEFETRTNIYPAGWTLAKIIAKAQSRVDNLVFQSQGKWSLAWWTELVNSVQAVAASRAGYKRVGFQVPVVANTQISPLPEGMCKQIRQIWIGDRQIEVTTDFALAKKYGQWRQVSAFPNQPQGGSIEVTSSSSADNGKSFTVTGTRLDGTYQTETQTLPYTDTLAWGQILTVTLAAACVGTVTLANSPGGVVITTITPGALTAGQCQNSVPPGGLVMANDGRPWKVVLDSPNMCWYPIPTQSWTATVYAAIVPQDMSATTDMPDSFPVAFQDILVDGAAALSQLADLYSSSQEQREQILMSKTRLPELMQFITDMSADRQEPIGADPLNAYSRRPLRR